jgi:hypothetical protein
LFFVGSCDDSVLVVAVAGAQALASQIAIAVENGLITQSIYHWHNAICGLAGRGP